MLAKPSNFEAVPKNAVTLLISFLSILIQASSDTPLAQSSTTAGSKPVTLFARILNKERFTPDRYTSKNVGALNYAGVYITWPQPQTLSVPLRGYSDIQITQGSLQQTSIFHYDTCNHILRFNPSHSQTEADWLSFDVSKAYESIAPLGFTSEFMAAARIQQHMDVRGWDSLLSIGMEYVSFVSLDDRLEVGKGGVKITKPVQDIIDDAPLKVCLQINNLGAGFGIYLTKALNKSPIAMIDDAAVNCSSAELYIDYGSGSYQSS